MSWLSDLFKAEPRVMDPELEEAVRRNREEAEKLARVSRRFFDSEGMRWRDEQTHKIIRECMKRVVRGHDA
ncbi:hypothetical protein [Rhodoligotrophos ferricapiens]|uniref:hypothetical protein n=1 Tax=Rhodoligotrophos ferricapiens TaxID=3069264 RepID=UPI00315DC48D